MTRGARTSTVVSVGKSVMLELSQEVFKKNVEKALVKHMKDVSEFLMKKSPLQNLSDERLALLATKCMLLRYS